MHTHVCCLHLSCYVLHCLGHGLSSCTPAGALLAASAAFCTTGDVLASCVPTGASHVLLLAYCMYVVLKLLRSALRVYEAPLVSCARAGVLHLGIPIRPCCATATMLLRAACIPVSTALVYMCWVLAQAGFVHVITLGICLSMALRSLPGRLASLPMNDVAWCCRMPSKWLRPYHHHRATLRTVVQDSMHTCK